MSFTTQYSIDEERLDFDEEKADGACCPAYNSHHTSHLSFPFSSILLSDTLSPDAINTCRCNDDIVTAMIMKCHELVKRNIELENENKKLKGLLKEGQEFISIRLDGLCFKEKDELLKNINEALHG